MDDFRHLLDRVGDSVVAAQANYQIWYTLRVQGQALPEYYDDMNDYRYVDFFHVISTGAYKLMFIELGCLFDSDERSASMENLRKQLVQIGREDLAAKIQKSLRPFNKLVSNIITIRSKLMAHKELGACSEAIHSKFGVVPNQVGTLIMLCCSLLNEVNTEINNEFSTLLCSADTQRFEQATFNLLRTLRSGRS